LRDFPEILAMKARRLSGKPNRSPKWQKKGLNF